MGTPGYRPPVTLVVEPAQETDFPAIADLTVTTYTSQGWAGPEYQVQLADVAGRRRRRSCWWPGGTASSWAASRWCSTASSAR